MKLADLIDHIPVVSISNSLEIEVDGLCFDSRKAKDGSVFFALKGVEADGHDFIESAIENGASAIVAEKPYPATTSATWIEVNNSRYAMALAAANFYGDPSAEMPVVGVTGTNGKTTTTRLIHYLFQQSWHRAGMLGTIDYVIGEESYTASHTTPEATDLQRMLREMRDAGCRAAVMEVSSHGLMQDRVTGVHFDAGVFTNLTQDHLDYHGTMDAYLEAKAKLFDLMANDSLKKGTRVINRDDTYGERLLKDPANHLETITFGRGAASDYRASNIQFDLDGTTFKLSMKGRQFLVKYPLIGLFNVYNVLAALAAGTAAGLNLREAVGHLVNCPQVPGRLENIRGFQTNYRVYVDYAHTPDALDNALTAVRALHPNRIITVFGCGGDRDRGKRPLMAKAAEENSDIVVLTSDNPRTEDPAQILRDAAAGFRNEGNEIIEDRRQAIARAIDLAGERDIVLIAGKGHETYQEIHGVRHDFDDRKVAYGCIAERSQREPETEGEVS